MYNSYAVSSNQPVSSVRTISYPMSAYGVPVQRSSPQNTTICSDTIKTDFGKIKGIEVLYFRNAQLERTIDGKNKFGSVGPLQVFYFPQYDRFVLSLNSWKYPLLKRVPIVGSSASHGVPVTYTLPTVNGFFTLVIPKVEHLDALANLETILEDNSKFTFSDSDDVLSHSNTLFGGQNMMLGNQIHHTQSNFLQVPQSYSMNGNVMHGSMYSPRYSAGTINQSFTQAFQSNAVQSQPIQIAPKKQSRWKRIFQGPEYRKDKGDRLGTSRHNLNHIQKRDLNAIKMTTEVMAAAVYYPRKEVERWIMYNKEMANIMNFSPELQDQDFDAMGHSSMNRSNIDVDPTLPCNQPITSDKPIESITYQVGRNFTSAVRRDGKKTDGYISGHSHSIHPEVSGRFNNLSTSQFETDRFRNMSNTAPLYEATGISPINKIDQPFTFTQDDILEESKPSITERIKGAITNTNETKHVELLRQQEKQMSFADNVQEVTPVSTLASTKLAGQTTGTFLSSPRAVQTNVISHNIENLQPNTQYISTTTAVPTLQERIRNTTTSTTERPGLLERMKERVKGTETTQHQYDLNQAHYAA